MPGSRKFLVYQDIDNPTLEPIILEIFEHVWRFFDILLLDLEVRITGFSPKIKYSDADGAIHKIRGKDDYTKFVEYLEKLNENDETILILERDGLQDGNALLNQKAEIFPSELRSVRYIGSGTNGVIRMGFDEKTNKWYVIKTILSRNDCRKKIEKEILAYEECSKSEFVVGYYGCEVSSSKKELVLEYMDKGDLRPYGIFPFAVHQQVALAVIRGLRHLWASGPGYIHRDIKPENILCNSSGYIKISDFGEAKRIDNTHRIASSAAGTAFYQAPEQRMGFDYDEKVDVWGFGLTLWELATGSTLEFDPGLSNDGIVIGHIEGFPYSLTDLLRNCLCYSPKDRWNGEQIEKCEYLAGVEINRELVRQFLNK